MAEEILLEIENLSKFFDVGSNKKLKAVDGISLKIRKGETTLEELAARAAELKAPKAPASGQQEYLEGVLNNIILSR